MPSSRRSSRRPYAAKHTPVDVERARGGMRLETGSDGDWNVRTVTSQDKTYRCPVCHGDIPPGVPHVVAWSLDDAFGRDSGVESRRHWHTNCFRRRTHLH